MSAHRRRRIGAAAFVLGMTIAGPQVAVATADTTDSDAATPAADSPTGRATAEALHRPKPRPVRSVEVSPRRTAPAVAHAAAATTRASAAVHPALVPAPRAVTVPAAPVAAATADPGCAVCWGAQAPSVGQAVGTAVNHLFNSAFTWLSAFPANTVSDLIGGALVLIRRALFVVPEGVSARMVGTTLTVTVNTGSVAYFRQDADTLQISGDPWFFGAQRFDDSADIAVAVGNPGNAGCAGLVLTAGAVRGALNTSQIDDIRFGSGAAFTQTVTASVTGGSLTLRDAVRGLTGVALNASVILANDVDIDAGSGDATFAGTVDANTAGKQSLTVTALGATTVAAAVGGVAPLAELLTQGIAPIFVTESEMSKTIALHYLPEFSSTGAAQVKYGIDVAIGENPSQLYEFDTGGVAFFGGYNPAFWSKVPLTSTAISETYSSGNYYNGVIADTRITLGTGSRTVTTAQPIQIAAILDGGNAKTGASFDFTNPDAPPVEDHFFGDFGASFATLAVNGLNTPLANPLFQLPGNLSSGFLVQLGPIGIQPQLTVGVTDALREQFPYAVPVAPQPGGGSYPVSGYDVLSWFGFAPSYTATQGSDEQQIGVTPSLPSLIDSGAPSTNVRLKGQGGDPFNVGGQLEPGTTFTAVFPTTAGRAPLQWSFVAGTNGSVNQVGYQQGETTSTIQNANTGLNLYNAFDVMFDVAEGVIWLRPTGAQSTVALASVTTTGTQTYRQSADLAGTYATGDGDFSVAGVTTLRATTTVNAGTGNVTFSGTVDAGTGSESLTVNSTGTTTFRRAVGGQQPLAGLTTDAGGSTSTSSAQTTGDQSYSDAASFSGMYSVANGTFSVAGPAALVGPVSVAGGDITFAGTIDSVPGRGYALTLTPGNSTTVRLNGDVGASHPLGGLTVSLNGDGSAVVNAPGYIALAGDQGFSADNGLYLGAGVTANFTGGGVIRGFTDSGAIIGQSAGSVLEDFTISGNGAEGIQLNGATGAMIAGNAIFGNGSDGVLVDTGTGNQILSNAIFGNGGTDNLGIRLTNGGNNNQTAPLVGAAELIQDTMVVTVTIPPHPDYQGTFTVQVFYTPAGGTATVQGQQLLYQASGVVAGSQQFNVPASGVIAGGFVTATVTREDGAHDTSEFSAGTPITG